MTDYTELVKALRCGEYKPECGSSDCTYWSGLGCMDGQLMEDAAAAIEELQSEVRFWEAAVKGQEDGIKVLQNEVKRLKMHCADCEYGNSPWPEEPGHEPKRGEWELIDGAEPMRWGCSRCKYMSWDTSNYCPRCGAKMTEVQE